MNKLFLSLKNRCIMRFRETMASRAGTMYIDMTVRILLIAGLGVVVYLLIYPLIRDLLQNTHDNFNNQIINLPS